MAERESVVSALAETSGIASNRIAAAWTLLESQDMGNVFARVVEAYDRRIDVASRALQESNSAKDMLALAAENKFHRVEKELRSVGERLKLHETENAKLRENVSEKDSVLRDLNERLNHLSSARDLTSREKNELVEKLEKSEEGRQELIVILEKKNDVIAKLDEEWNDMSARLAKANKAKNDAMLQLGEIQSKETLSKFKDQRLAEEKELLTSQNEWLQSQLRTKSNEMVSMRHEGASDRVDLRVQLSGKEQEVGRLDAIVQETQKVNRELEAKLDVYLNKLKEVRDEKMASDEHHNNELAAQSKLTALYQKSSEELDGRVQEMLTAVEELQVTVDRGNKYQAELEEEKEALAARAGLLETKVKELEEKLEEARSHSLSEKTLREVYPSAAASSARLKSGMTLTQIYSSYVDAKEALTKEQEENKELRKEIDLILRELNTKAPMLQEQRKRFEETLTMNDYISKKLGEATEEIERQRTKALSSERLCSDLKKSDGALRQQVEDLKQQVRTLLRECEEIRGGLGSSTDDAAALASGQNLADVSSSSQVISERLVTFKNVDELQQVNLELLSVVRKLSEQQENEERIQADSRVAELKNQLDQALADLNELKAARKRQEDMVEAVVRQRDMYRVLAQGGKSPTKTADVSILSSSPSKSLGGGDDAMEVLQKEFELYRTETSKNAKLMESRIEELRDKASKLESEKVKLGSQLEFSKEKAEMLNVHMESRTRELNILQERNQNMTDVQSKLETALEKSRQELATIQEKCVKAEHMQGMLKLERDQLKSSEGRLLQLNEDLMKERKGQNLLLGNLQTLQANLEKNDILTQTKLSSRIESLEQELAEVRREATVERQRYTDLSLSLQKRLQHSDDELKRISEKLQSALKDHQSAETLKIEAEEKVKELSKSLEAAKQRISQLTSSGDDADESERPLLELRNQIKTLQDQNDGLKGRVDQLQRQADDYKALSLANEESLQVANSVNVELQHQMDERLKTLKDKESAIQDEMEKAFQAKSDVETEMDALQKRSQEQLQDLRQTIAKLKNELSEAIAAKERARESEMAANAEYQATLARAQEAQDKYEKELLLHSKDVQLHQVVKEELRKAQRDKDVWAQKLKEEQLKHAESAATYAAQIKTAEEAKGDLESRVQDLLKQNEILHSQGDELSHRLALAKPGASAVALTGILSGDLTEGQSEDHGQRSASELWDVIRFLRREKEIAETRCEVIEADCVRYKQRYSHVEQQLEETRKALGDEKEKSDVSAMTAQQHADVMDKVNNLNVFMESNKVLREEKNVLAKQIDELKEKIKQLEGEISPLTESNKALIAQRDLLLAEKTALKNEIARWTARTNHLIEQCNRVDPEEYRDLLEHREKSGSKIAELEKELAAASGQLKSMEGELEDMGRAFRRATDESVASKAAAEEVRKDLEAKAREMEEKTKTVQSLKNIGRKYRSQFEKAKADLEQAEKRLEEQKKVVQVDESLQEKTTALEGKIESLTKEVEEQKKENKDQAGIVADKEEKLKRAQNVMKRTAERMKTLTSQKEKLAAEVKTLKESGSSVATAAAATDEEQSLRDDLLKQQYEAKVAKLEQQVQQGKTELKEMQEKYGALLNQKLKQDRQLLQKRGRMKETAPTTKPQVAAVANQSSNVVTPVTANVIPTVASTQPMPTATVKPIPAVLAGPTPTAAVLPTAVGTSSSLPMPDVGAAGTSGSSESAAASGPAPDAVPAENRSLPSGGGGENVAAATTVAVPSTEVPTEAPTPAVGEGDAEEGELRSGPNSRAPSPVVALSTKRPREDETLSSIVASEDDGPSSKKVKVTESDEVPEQPQETEVSSTDVSTAPRQSVEATATCESSEEVPRETSAVDPADPVDSEKMDVQEAVVEGGQSQDDTKRTEIVGSGEEGDLDDAPVESQEPEEPDATRKESGSQSIEGEQKEPASSEPPAPPPSSSSSSSLSVAQAFSRPSGGESRLQKARSELQRFSFAGHPSMHYDESEDSTVPHTPVLNPPARNDEASGFAQMIASPQVSLQLRFPSTTSSQSESSGVGDGPRGTPGIVTQSGMGMDETCIELRTGQEEDADPKDARQEEQVELTVVPIDEGDDVIEIDAEADSGEAKPPIQVVVEDVEMVEETDRASEGDNVVDSGEMAPTEAEAENVEDKSQDDATTDGGKEDPVGSVEPPGLGEEFPEESDDIALFNEPEEEAELGIRANQEQSKIDQSESKADGTNDGQTQQASGGASNVPRGRRIIIRSSAQSRTKSTPKGKANSKNGD